MGRGILIAAAVLAFGTAPALAGVPANAVNGDMSLGDPKAKVQVTEYASAACPHCAHFDETVFPAFKAKYVDTGKVHYTLKEFLTAPPEVAAAGFLVARCGGPAKYFPILHDVFASQSQWRTGDIGPILIQAGVKNGLAEKQVESCLTDQAALDALNGRVTAAMDKDKIDSTPTLVVNGKKLEAVDLASLEAAIAEAAKAAPQKAGKPPARKKPARR
ncbi:thioredoxin domain-containing protein [Phenylobacterium soli]|uniref:DsbA family protein n=1 Tax=Phenylobacterium soli TaxID=2170551 RepID=A0A328AHK1_9CAUL|nr:thioredoxin domain-containing protein [Phenylobacterium soli]RAK54230.1 DsbA family protein [Phenylobacterium soli]